MSGLEIQGLSGGVAPGVPSGRVSAGGGVGGFAGQLRDARAAVKVSAHARQRLAQQNVPVDAALLSRLGEATDRAAEKGSRESLMILGGVGFIVNVPNRTVKTAVAAGRMQEGIFTNIDSAVLKEA
jgi:flagellar operon protein